VWHGVLEAVSFYLVLGLALLAVTTGVLVYLLGRFLAPLGELAAQAAGIETDSLVFRPPSSALHTRELAPLTSALSEMIERVRLSFEAQHRFVNDAAHELKTAVAVVRSTIQVLAMRPRSLDEYRAGLDQLLGDNERVEALVARMLTLARVSEHAQPALVSLDLAEETDTALKNISSFAESRGVAVIRSLSSGVCVLLPPDAAQVLVSNLVVNAVQYSPRGTEVWISVRLSPESDLGAVLEVEDLGYGIAPENLTRVFERFFREDPSRARETGGVGLGLPISKRIVEAAGGRIELTSVQGKGTTVRAWFPLALPCPEVSPDCDADPATAQAQEPVSDPVSAENRLPE
jgi:signal transduction histidine kinase